MTSNDTFSALSDAVMRLGAYKAAVISTVEIKLDKAFRDMCAANSCGMYGKCYMCPPHVGDADTLMRRVTEYEYALVYQTVAGLEDSFDFEGMVAAKRRTNLLVQELRKVLADKNISKTLHLGAGGCGACETCAKMKDEPCRHPELAMPSLEAYCVNVSELSAASGMKYINGRDTVTYFGAVLFDLN